MPLRPVFIAALASLFACSRGAPSKDSAGEHAASSAETAQPKAPAPIDAATPLTADAGRAASDLATKAIEIIDRPITWNEEREALTLEYRRTHQGPQYASTEIVPAMIVLHHTSGPTATSTIRYFNRVRMEQARGKLKKAAALNVSAHFLVDRDGTIYRLLPETTMARHCIGLNHVAIGVENVGGGEKLPLTDAQVQANIALVRYLAGKHPITHLIGHHEYREMEGQPLFLELDPAYRNRKDDPGPGFMQRVRAGVEDLQLLGP